MNKKQRFNFILGAAILGIVLLFILAGIVKSPYDPNAMDGKSKFLAPCLSHWFGTDHFGRDILSRVMEGAKITCLISLAVVAFGGAAGTIIGALTGYFGGLLDEIVMRINDIAASFPSILLALVLVSLIGTGTPNLILALGIAFIPTFARVVRSEFVVQKEMDYVRHARLMGAGHFRIIFIHILPNIRQVLLSTLTIAFNSAVLAEAGMSFLGLGVQPPDPSLGRMLAEAQTYLDSAPWYALFPGLFVILIVLGFSLLSSARQEQR